MVEQSGFLGLVVLALEYQYTHTTFGDAMVSARVEITANVRIAERGVTEPHLSPWDVVQLWVGEGDRAIHFFCCYYSIWVTGSLWKCNGSSMGVGALHRPDPLSLTTSVC